MTTPGVRLKDLCEDAGQYGLNVSASEYASAGVRMLRTTDLGPNGQLRDDVDPVFVANPPGGRFLLDDGDLLLTRSGSVGRSFLVHALSDPTTFAGFLIRFRPRPSTDPRFLAYVAESTPFQDAVQADAISSTIQNFNAERYANIKVPNPPLDEQRRIADFLDTETTRIDVMASALTRRSRLASTRIQALRDSLLIPRAISPRGPDWPLVPIKHVASFFTDGDWIESPFIVDAGIRLIQTGNVGVGAYREQGFRYVSEDTFRELRCTEVVPCDVLISRLASPAGRACLAPHLPDRMIASVDVAILRPTGDLDPAFAVHYMSTSAHLQLADLEARGTTMQRLSRRQLGDLLLPVPPLPEQRRLREGLDDAVVMAGRLITANDAQLRVLAERRQALITAAVTGQLDVTTAWGGRS